MLMRLLLHESIKGKALQSYGLWQEFSSCIGNYCAFQKPVKMNFLWYYFYFLPNQAHTHLDHLKILDELWDEISFESKTGEEFPHRPQL